MSRSSLLGVAVVTLAAIPVSFLALRPSPRRQHLQATYLDELVYTFSTPSGAPLSSPFEGTHARTATCGDAPLMFGQRLAAILECGQARLWPNLRAWIDPPSVKACAPEYCTGHYFEDVDTQSGDCWYLLCTSGGGLQPGVYQL